MSSVEELLREGILGRVESIASTRGEQVSIVATGFAPSHKGAYSGYGCNPSGDASNHEKKAQEGIIYAEIHDCYHAVAAQLKFRFGVQRGDKVLVCGKGQAAAEIIALLACMQIQAPFVPIDASWVVGTRLRDIVQDAKPMAAVVVAAGDNDQIVTSLAAAGLYRCVYLTPTGELVQSFATQTQSSIKITNQTTSNTTTNTTSNTVHHNSNTHPLYILYTSGSTGKPKGVVGTHRGLVNRIAWQMKHYPFGPNEVVCRRTPLVFVDAMAEIFSALVCRAPLWCPPVEQMRAEGIGGIAAQAHAVGVSRITLLPSQLYQACMLYPDIGSTWRSLKLAIVSGEECTAGVVNIVKQRLPGVTLLNLYGSTEVAGDVTYHVAHDGAQSSDPNPSTSKVIFTNTTVPIGRPIDNNYLFIVQRTNTTETTSTISDITLLPDNTTGELMVVGEHSALGYHNNAPSNSATFAPNPLCHARFAQDPLIQSPTAREYKQAFFTGDLAYRTSEGVYHWCGRADRQVKIRGVRMELEDVERQISTVLAVDQGIVVLAVSLNNTNSTNAANSDVGKSLVLFIEQTALTHTIKIVEQVKQHLLHTIPSTMMPALVLSVGAFPRNTSGKIDRKVLQAQVESMFESTHETAHIHTISTATDTTSKTSITALNTDAIATHILSTYAQILNIPPTTNTTTATTTDSLKSDFFSLGGDSVKMIEVLWTLRQWSQVSIAPADLQLSVQELAKQLYLRAQAPASESESNPVKKQRVSDDQTTSTTYTATSSTAVTNSIAISGSGYPLPTAGAALPAGFADNVRYSAGRSGNGTYLQRFQHAGNTMGSCVGSCVGNGVSDMEGTLSVKWSVPLVKCVDAAPLLIIAPHLNPTTNDTSSTTSLVTTPVTTTANTTTTPPPHLVIIGSHGGDVVAVNSRSGDIVWTLQLGEHIEAAAVADNTASRVFIGTFSGQDVDGFKSKRPLEESSDLGCFWCIDALAGEILWHYATAGEIKGSALVVGDCVFVGAYDGHLHQLRASDGILIAKYACGGSVYAAPVLSCDEKCIFVATTAGTLTQFAYKGGEEKLTRFLPNIKTAPIFATPAATPGGGLLVATTDGGMSLYTTADTGARLKHAWTQAMSDKPFFSSPCTVLDSEGALCGLIASHDGHLRLFDAINGTIRWGESTNNLVLFASPCLLFPDICVSATVAGDVVVSNMSDGQVLSSVRLPGEVFSSPVCVGNCVYVGCRDDRMYCLEFK